MRRATERLVWIVAAALWTACPKAGPTPNGAGGGGEAPFDLTKARAALTLPATNQTATALAAVGRAAERGDPEAAWVEAHYLIDLLDWARFHPDLEARGVLIAAVGATDARGSATTDAVLDAILVRVDRILARDRLHQAAQAARTILSDDRTPARARGDLFARMTALKGVARGGGPLAANATLRLASFCRVAFADAAAAPFRERARILSHCLYPLFDSDPDPYFADDPARRPPAPHWKDLADGVAALEREIASSPSRIAPLGTQLAAQDAAALAQAAALYPAKIDARALGLPIASTVRPYDFTPLVLLGDGSNPPPELAKQLAPLVEQDGRGRAAAAFAAQAPATALVSTVQALLAAGAGELELVVGYEQQLRAPPGDYWRERAIDGKTTRLGVLPIALDLIAPVAIGEGRDAPRARGWDPARASLGLHLIVKARSWQIVAPEGEFAAIAVDEQGAQATRELGKLLRQIRDAYPDEGGIAIVAGEGATVGSIARGALAALVDDAGAPLFDAIALAQTRPQTSPKGTLVERVRRRSAARVTIAPDALADRVPVARRCYLDALERDPKLSGTLVLEYDERGRGVKVVSGPKDEGLRRCVGERVGQAMIAAGVRDAKVELAAGR